MDQDTRTRETEVSCFVSMIEKAILEEPLQEVMAHADLNREVGKAEEGLPCCYGDLW